LTRVNSVEIGAVFYWILWGRISCGCMH